MTNLDTQINVSFDTTITVIEPLLGTPSAGEEMTFAEYLEYSDEYGWGDTTIAAKTETAAYVMSASDMLNVVRCQVRMN